MSKKKSYVPLSKIKNALRRIHMHDKQKATAKAKCKIDSALFLCEIEDCKIAMYEGVSEKNFRKLAMKWGATYEVVKAKLEMDHIEEVVEVKKGFCDWNTYIERLYCGPEGYQGLCRTHHAEKTAIESAQRAESGSLKRKK